MVQLEELYEELLGRLPTEPETNLTLSAANCARPPDEVETQNLKVLAWRLGHDYGDCARYDVVEFFADTASYQRFGLLLFASVFHPNRQVTLHLRHAEATVKKIRIECGIADAASPHLSGLATVPVAYGYSPSPIGHIHGVVAGKSFW